jgi:peptide/nickel transport system substrate-binding protein
MIGTGPFKVKSFDPTTGNVSTERNPNYWRKDADGTQLPYLDGINFVPQGESQQRINGLQGGQFDVTESSGGQDLNKVEALGGGIYTVVEPEGRMELEMALPNVSIPPLDDLTCRKAIAEGTDRDALNAIAQDGVARLTDQVVDTRIMGYVDDPGYPTYDKADAKNLADDCKASHGGKFEITLQSTFDRTTQALAQELKRQMAQIGVTVTLPPPVDQAQIINLAIAGGVDSFLWRNYPGSDPDTLYVWFHGGSPVNFNHIDDPIMNEALDKGRSEQDPDTRAGYYETFNKRLSSQVYNFYSWYTQWFIGSAPDVHGFIGPNLPDETGAPGTEKAIDVLAGYHQMLGIWKDQ